MTQIIRPFLLTLLLSSHALALDAVRDLGLVPNDPAIDNGPALNAALASTRETLRIPGGVYYHSTPIRLEHDAVAIEAQGFQRWKRVGALKNTAAAIFVYVGPGDQPAWSITGDGCRLMGINIWGGFYGERKPGVGLAVRDWGRHHSGHCGIAGFDVGIAFEGGNHADCSTFTNTTINSCLTSVRCRNRQSSGIVFTGLWIDGSGETVFDYELGGNLTVTGMVLNMPRLVLRAKGASTSCTYIFDGFKADNDAAGWRLADTSGPMNLFVRGHIGNKATPGDKPLVIRDYMSQPQRAVVDLWGPVLERTK
jgi:hypothetical protein